VSAAPSLEVRWLFEGAVPDEVERWFREGPALGPGGARGDGDWPRTPAGDPAWRDDRYRVVPGAPDLGIKWREGRLEVKGREAALGTWHLGARAVGAAERWLKWSVAGGAVAAAWGAGFDASADAVVRVGKCRGLRKLALDAAGAVREVPADRYPERVIGAELTRIRLDGADADTHWTLGLEAAPASAALEAAFAPAAAAFLAGCPRVLPPGHAMSYPEWLLGVRG